MIKLHSKQHVRFAKIDQGTAWVVVAVLLETTGNETVAISEPKVVKIIPKDTYALSSGKASPQAILGLTAPTQLLVSHAILTPYFSYIFGSEKSSFIMGLAAQPPTQK